MNLQSLKTILFFLAITFLISSCGKDDNPDLGNCTDGIQNNGETGIDCGGTCTDCITYPISLNFNSIVDIGPLVAYTRTNGVITQISNTTPFETEPGMLVPEDVSHPNSFKFTSATDVEYERDGLSPEATYSTNKGQIIIKFDQGPYLSDGTILATGDFDEFVISGTAFLEEIPGLNTDVWNKICGNPSCTDVSINGSWTGLLLEGNIVAFRNYSVKYTR